MTGLQFLTWMEWLRLRDLAGEPDLDMTGFVPEETQKRWHDKHHSARFQAAALGKGGA